MNFNYDKEDPDPIGRYAMRKENGRCLSNNLNIVFLELRKIKDCKKEELKDLEPLYKWGLFLKDADNLEKTELIESLTNEESGLMNAKQTLSSISANRDLWIQQYRQEMMERDRISGLEAAERKGRIQGILKTAKKMLSMGISIDMIKEATDLTEEEILNLK